MIRTAARPAVRLPITIAPTAVGTTTVAAAATDGVDGPARFGIPMRLSDGGSDATLSGLLAKKSELFTLGMSTRSWSRQLWSTVALLVDDKGAGLATISGKERKQLASMAVAALAQPSTGVAGLLARSACCALLESLLRRPGTQLEEGSKLAWRAALARAVMAEPNPGLRQHLVQRYSTPGAQKHLLAGVPTALSQPVKAAVIAAKHNSSDSSWRTRTPPTLNITGSVQEEFFASEVRGYKQQGFEVSTQRDDAVELVKQVPNAMDKDGPPVTVVATLHKRDEAVLSPLSDRDADMVYYSGHADLGAVARTSMTHGPGQVAGQKLVAFLSCRSAQERDELQRRYPGQQLLLSQRPTTADDDRVVLHALINGIVAGEDHQQVETRARRQLEDKDNYLFPTENAALAQADVPLLYTPTLPSGRESMSMLPATEAVPLSSPVVAAAKGKARDAVAWLNTIHSYWSEVEGGRSDRALADRFSYTGFFAGSKDDPITRVSFTDGTDGKPRVQVSINGNYAHQHRDALCMMVTFDAMQQVFARTRPTEALSDRRLRSMAMAAESTQYLVEHSDVADVLLRQFASRFGFPSSLTNRLTALSLAADPHNDCTEKTLAVYRRGLSHGMLEVNETRKDADFRAVVNQAMALLRKNDSPVAKVTYEAIATGQVKVDSLDDLTRHDFLELRKELVADVPSLAVAQYRSLLDKRTSGYRAIATAIDGYMWDNRVYLSPSLSPQQMASTLVHEVNHVLNDSELHYADAPSILREEYRAAYAEALFADGTNRKSVPKKEALAIKQRVIDLYMLKGVTPNDVPDVPPGILFHTGSMAGGA